MDLDTKLMSYHRRLNTIEEFINKLQAATPGGVEEEQTDDGPDGLGDLQRLKAELQAMLPELIRIAEAAREAAADYAAVAAAFKPTFDWVQAKMAEEDATKAAATAIGEPAEAADEVAEFDGADDEAPDSADHGAAHDHDGAVG